MASEQHCPLDHLADTSNLGQVVSVLEACGAKRLDGTPGNGDVNLDRVLYQCGRCAVRFELLTSRTGHDSLPKVVGIEVDNTTVSNCLMPAKDDYAFLVGENFPTAQPAASV